MAISVKHTTQAVGTNAGNGEIGKDQWNEDHTLILDPNKLVGRSSSGTGAAEEISVGAGLTLSGGELTATGTPGGSNTEVQFNSGGSISGDPNFTFTNITAGTSSLPSLDVGGAVVGYKELFGGVYGPGFMFDGIDSYYDGISLYCLDPAKPGSFYFEPNFMALQSGDTGTGWTQVNFTAPTADSGNVNYTLTLPKTAGSADQVLSTNGSGTLSWVDQPTLTPTTPSGSNTEIQVNDSGSFGSNSAFTYTANSYGGVLTAGGVYMGNDAVRGQPTIDFGGLSNLTGYQLYLVSGSDATLVQPYRIILKNTSGGIDIRAAANAAYNLVLPSSAGSANQLLTTDGSGNLSWSTLIGLTDGDKGHITVSSSGTSWTIDDNTVDLTTKVTGVLPVASGGTGKTTGVAALSNLGGFETTVTANTTTTLTNTSHHRQQFTGTNSQTLVLPDVTTLQLGWTYYILNTSTGFINVQSSGGNAVASVTGNSAAFVTCIAVTGTTDTSWHYQHAGSRYRTGTGNSVFATSPVLVTPNLGTPSAGVLTSCTGLPLTTGITGTLAIANGGTGATTNTAARTNLGVGTGDTPQFSGVLATGNNGVGYTTGAGGTVTQATSRTTNVTLNKMSGAITLFSAAATTSATTFTVVNTQVTANDVIIVNQKSGALLYDLFVSAVSTGGFNITYRATSGTTTEQPVFSFAVIRGAVA